MAARKGFDFWRVHFLPATHVSYLDKFSERDALCSMRELENAKYKTCVCGHKRGEKPRLLRLALIPENARE